ncbi:monovalent cation/H(+) antiporter subunit G [Deinococcus peraridilitoris]|uniref:Monovalent cation/proton antiporter, MnhG/PhaG subunit n=1 Tax=Deinococcus peraridilitoris (strain DSM 19664 / LMG 22246 / CIP 109416 / KR-200) TaxID=937777 RepID=L0A0X9_DEIPD|nr:monovalent cation/H(+) antiporter subunit G [Deinococcus peraridilitoris]AFZ66645.1 monovalent cation/proton antiporter, MnhG/PhaG subunit [Deinococcus peraridilitoris DSM 19664]
MNDTFVWARDLPILLGAFFVLTAAVGVLRFPDLYSRLHASSKLVTLGSAGIFIGAIVEFAEVEVAARVLAILAFQFLTTPLSAYIIANAAYLRGLPPRLERPGADEWNALGLAEEEAAPHPARAAAQTRRE